MWLKSTHCLLPGSFSLTRIFLSFLPPLSHNQRTGLLLPPLVSTFSAATSFSSYSFPFKGPVTPLHRLRKNLVFFFSLRLHFFIFFNGLFIFERNSTSGAQRWGWTEDPKQAPRWQQRARRGAQTHGPWEHDLSQGRVLNRMSDPGAPKILFF